MATHWHPILNHTLAPDTSGKVWFEPYDILATNDVWKHLVVRYDEDGNNNAQISTRAGVYGAFAVPQNYVGSAVLLLHWTGTVTSGNVVWDFDYRTVGGDDTTSLDQSGTEEAVTGTDAAPTAANRRLQFTINLTSANLAAGETVEFFLANDGVDAADTYAGARLLHGAYLQYADV